MVETFFLDWGLSFGAGVLFGLLAESPDFGTRAFRWGLGYLHGGIMAIAIALYVARPDWMWMFWVDDSVIPVAVVILAFALYELCFVAGFTIAPALERARRRSGVALGLFTLAAIGAGQIAARDRLLRLESGEVAFLIAAGGASLLALALIVGRLARR